MTKAFEDGVSDGKALAELQSPYYYSTKQHEYVAGVVWGFTSVQVGASSGQQFSFALGQNAYRVGLTFPVAYSYIAMTDNVAFEQGFHAAMEQDPTA